MSNKEKEKEMENYGSFLEVSVRNERLLFSVRLGSITEREALYAAPLRLLSGMRPGGLWVVGLRGEGEPIFGGFDLSLSSLPLGAFPDFLHTMDAISLHVRVRGEQEHDEFELPVGPEVRGEIRTILRQQWTRRRDRIRRTALQEMTITLDSLAEENRAFVSATYMLAGRLSRIRSAHVRVADAAVAMLA